MTFLVTANQRKAKKRGIEGGIFGKSGIDKTSLLWTPTEISTLFFNIESGGLTVDGWQGKGFRPKTWQEYRDLAYLSADPTPHCVTSNSTASRTLMRCVKNTVAPHSSIYLLALNMR